MCFVACPTLPGQSALLAADSVRTIENSTSSSLGSPRLAFRNWSGTAWHEWSKLPLRTRPPSRHVRKGVSVWGGGGDSRPRGRGPRRRKERGASTGGRSAPSQEGLGPHQSCRHE